MVPGWPAKRQPPSDETSRRFAHLAFDRFIPIIRVTAALPPTADDADIIAYAADENRTIITQDLDFSALIALTQSKAPSLISLRLSSSRIEYVNDVWTGALKTKILSAQNKLTQSHVRDGIAKVSCDRLSSNSWARDSVRARSEPFDLAQGERLSTQFPKM